MFAGPFDSGASPPLVDEIHRAGDGDPTKGTGWTLVPFDRKNLEGNNAHPWLVDASNFALIDRQRRRVVAFTRAVKPVPGRTCYLYAELDNARDRVMCLELDAPGVKAYVNGVPLADNGRCHVPEGVVSMLLAISFGESPVDELHISPRLWDAEDPEQCERDWLAFVRRHKEHLKRAVELAPDSREGRRAAAVLAQL
jgi:hypothetical protein